MEMSSTGHNDAKTFDEEWLCEADWRAEWRSGGIHEFEKTGVYPEKITFENRRKGFRRTQKLNLKKRRGEVVKAGKVFFHYQLREGHCLIFFKEDPHGRAMSVPLDHLMVD